MLFVATRDFAMRGAATLPISEGQCGILGSDLVHLVGLWGNRRNRERKWAAAMASKLNAVA